VPRNVVAGEERSAAATSSGRPMRRTMEERSEAISTYLSYSGPFEVLPDQDTVFHHIEVCSYPNWIGNAQVRFAKLEGDVLTLSTKPMTFQGVERRAELV
jgi:hypothetical protein